MANRVLERSGREVRIDHRSHAEQGTGRLPQVHLGPQAATLEKRGVATEKGEHNRAVAEHNAVVVDLEKAQLEEAGGGGRLTAEQVERQRNGYAAELGRVQGQIDGIRQEGMRLMRAEGIPRQRDQAAEAVERLRSPLSAVKRWFSAGARAEFRQAQEQLAQLNSETVMVGVTSSADLPAQVAKWEKRQDQVPRLEQQVAKVREGIDRSGKALEGFRQENTRWFDR